MKIRDILRVLKDDGEIFYAKQGAGETPAANEDFANGRFEMGTTAYTEAETDTYNEFDVSGTSAITGSNICPISVIGVEPCGSNLPVLIIQSFNGV